MMRIVCWFLPISPKKIVFSSYCGRGYGDNPKYISEEIIKMGMDYQMIWMINDEKEAESLPIGIVPCKLGSLKWIYHLTTARIWVDNCRKPFYYKKRGQYYIQTWHGFALKRIEMDVKDSLEEIYVELAKKDSKHTDIIISDSKFMTSIYEKSFWYDGKIVEWGSPRNDIFALQGGSEESKKAVCAFYDIPRDCNIVLYAPTFRVDGSLKPYQIDLEKVKATCENKFGGRFIVLVRLHPNIAKKSTELRFDWNQHIDASKYPDMQVLLSATDVVISDYSSLMFDFALSGKPCFQFATDIEAYKKDRNFYFQLDRLPFSVSQTNDELMEAIQLFDEVKYKQNVDRFFENVGMYKIGDASKKCAALIREICEKGHTQ